MTITVDMLTLGPTLVQPALRSALERLDPQTRHFCGYHLGLWDADGEPGPGAGKQIRSALALLSTVAARAPIEDGIPAAVAVELVHNFSLLHDDLMDGDRVRRHRPTVWAVFGSSAAILAGDALLSLASEILAEAPSPTVPWAIRCLSATTRRLIAGQSADLAFESRFDVTLAECRRMAADKTGALLACSASLGAVLADGPAELALALAGYGEHLGMAFQLHDDLLGIWGEPALTGKPVLSDLRSRKKSLPVVAALTSDTPAGDKLAELYLAPVHSESDDAADQDYSDDDQLNEFATLIKEAGGRSWAEQSATTELALALDSIAGLDLPTDVAAEFQRLARWLAGRES